MYCAKKMHFKLRTHNYFVLTSGKDEVIISFKSKFLAKSSRPN